MFIAMDEYGGCNGGTRADTLEECIENTIKLYGCKARPATKESLLAGGMCFIEYKHVLGWMVGKE